MGTDVASFAKQLREDGIEAAKEESAKILADARKEAEKIVNSAKSEAAKVEKEAQTRISQNQNSSESEMRMVARDIIIGLKKKIEEIGTNLHFTDEVCTHVSCLGVNTAAYAHEQSKQCSAETKT